MNLHNLHLGQLDQGFPHRGTGQAHLGGQGVLADLAARGQLQADDVFFDGPQGVVPAGLPGEAFGKLHIVSCSPERSARAYVFHCYYLSTQESICPLVYHQKIALYFVYYSKKTSGGLAKTSGVC